MTTANIEEAKNRAKPHLIIFQIMVFINAKMGAHCFGSVLPIWNCFNQIILKVSRFWRHLPLPEKHTDKLLRGDFACGQQQ